MAIIESNVESKVIDAETNAPIGTTKNIQRVEVLEVVPNVDRAKEIVADHEKFNILGISPLVVLTALAFAIPRSWSTLFLMANYVLTYGTFTYILVDTIYYLYEPRIQPNKVRYYTIIVHHLLTMVLLLNPMLVSEHVLFTRLCTIVEINTILLTLNKMYRLKCTHILFLVSWVVLRLVWYPYLIYVFWEAMERSGATAFPPSPSFLQVVGSFTCLCLLNFYWTAEFTIMNRKKTNPDPVEVTASRTEDAVELSNEYSGTPGSQALVEGARVSTADGA